MKEFTLSHTLAGWPRDADNLIGHGRVYGGGLYKIEPKELGRIPGRGIMAAAPLHGNVRQAELFTEG